MPTFLVVKEYQLLFYQFYFYYLFPRYFRGEETPFHDLFRPNGNVGYPLHVAIGKKCGDTLRFRDAFRRPNGLSVFFYIYLHEFSLGDGTRVFRVPLRFIVFHARDIGSNGDPIINLRAFFYYALGKLRRQSSVWGLYSPVRDGDASFPRVNGSVPTPICSLTFRFKGAIARGKGVRLRDFATLLRDVFRKVILWSLRFLARYL